MEYFVGPLFIALGVPPPPPIKKNHLPLCLNHVKTNTKMRAQFCEMQYVNGTSFVLKVCLIVCACVSVSVSITFTQADSSNHMYFQAVY